MSNRKLRQATKKGRLPLTAFLAYFSPQEQDGDHSFMQVQFNETYQYRSKKGV